ncbi:flagellar biosynthesis anti-sigma factor FlgM [Oxalobacter sp. OttesenSCG-928-P03]|nr:flagellar biosynthesis anti-sigma factor FlgM [Oxalobacter sp. OttesenSCG-928-P03]
MKIDDSMKKAATTSTTDVKQRQTANTGATKAGGSARSPATSGASGSGSTDSAVNVSLSTQLQSVMEQVGDTAVFDAKKVDEIKAAISGGNFQVDTGKVADGLIKTVSELIQKPRE